MSRYQWMQRQVLWLHPQGLSNWESCFYQEIRKQTKYEKDWLFLHIDSVFCFSDPFFLYFYLINTCFLYFSSFITESCVPLCFQSRQEGWTSKTQVPQSPAYLTQVLRVWLARRFLVFFKIHLSRQFYLMRFRRYWADHWQRIWIKILTEPCL